MSATRRLHRHPDGDRHRGGSGAGYRARCTDRRTRVRRSCSRRVGGRQPATWGEVAGTAREQAVRLAPATRRRSPGVPSWRASRSATQARRPPCRRWSMPSCRAPPGGATLAACGRREGAVRAEHRRLPGDSPGGRGTRPRATRRCADHRGGPAWRTAFMSSGWAAAAGDGRARAWCTRTARNAHTPPRRRMRGLATFALFPRRRRRHGHARPRAEIGAGERSSWRLEADNSPDK